MTITQKNPRPTEPPEPPKLPGFQFMSRAVPAIQAALESAGAKGLRDTELEAAVLNAVHVENGCDVMPRAEQLTVFHGYSGRRQSLSEAVTELITVLKVSGDICTSNRGRDDYGRPLVTLAKCDWRTESRTDSYRRTRAVSIQACAHCHRGETKCSTCGHQHETAAPHAQQ